MNPNPQKTRRNRLFWLLGSVAALAAVTVSLVVIKPGRQGANGDSLTENRRAVTIVEVTVGAHAAAISGFAEVQPRWSSTLRAQVDGQLLHVSDLFQPGVAVSAGQVLAVVDSTAWVANLAEAETRVAVAEMNLLRALEEADEARRSWLDAGLDGEPDSRLVLHEPQTEAARVERDAARVARDWAARQLAQTRIHAPFAGIITSREVSRGESVMTGETVGELFATDAFELGVPISEARWRALPEPLIGIRAEVEAQDGVGSWQAHVIRQGASVDPASRMRTLYLEVTRPLAADSPLLPGTFVEVHLLGREVPGLLEIPEGAMTRKGQVWYVDTDDRLARFDAEVVFTRAGLVYVREPQPADLWRIVRYPLASYLTGQNVRPVTQAEEF